MNSFSDRIKLFIDESGTSIKAFEKSIGASNGLIGKTIREKRGLGSDFLEKIFLLNPELNPDWLVTGRGEMLKKKSAPKNYEGNDKPIPIVREGKSLPLIPVEAMAGIGEGEYSVKDVDISDRYVVPEFTNADFMIRVKGNSMYPKYNSGDIVACQKIYQRQFIQWGKVYVLDTTQGALVKKIMPTDDEKYIQALSVNSDYPPFKILLKDIRAIALVIGVIRFE